jgi:hypothetical protein
MFLALCREGELAFTPSGRKVVILGMHAGAVKVQCCESGEDFEILPRHLRHCDGSLAGMPVTAIREDVVADILEAAGEPPVEAAE